MGIGMISKCMNISGHVFQMFPQGGATRKREFSLGGGDVQHCSGLAVVPDTRFPRCVERKRRLGLLSARSNLNQTKIKCSSRMLGSNLLIGTCFHSTSSPCYSIECHLMEPDLGTDCELHCCHSSMRSMYCDRECSIEGWRRPLGKYSDEVNPPIVALGKFDALHRGHQALAIAAAELGGSPWLVSFSGMAEVLGWPARLPLVAPSDRKRVMKAWADSCGGQIPAECGIPFKEVREMSPESFVSLLANDLQVAGVVVGSNYRFGYKASGTAATLQELGSQYGMKIRIVDLVADIDDYSYLKDGKYENSIKAVSSSVIREALSRGDMGTAEYCLGRPYRLVVAVANMFSKESNPKRDMCLPIHSYMNQPPQDGKYTVRVNILENEHDTVSGKGDDLIDIVLREGCCKVIANDSKEILLEIFHSSSINSRALEECHIAFDFTIQ